MQPESVLLVLQCKTDEVKLSVVQEAFFVRVTRSVLALCFSRPATFTILVVLFAGTIHASVRTFVYANPVLAAGDG